MDQETPGATLPEPSAAELAAEEALSRAHVPPGMVVNQERGPGARMAAEAERMAAVLPGGDDVEAEPDETRDAMNRLAQDRMTEADMAIGLDWLLSDKQEVNTRLLKVRAGGSDDEPVYLEWIIRAANTDEIRQSEREGQGITNRAQQRGNEPPREADEMRANLRLIAVATMSVNGRPLNELSMQAAGIRDPAIWLRQRFHYRAGLIPALASEIMSLSGFAADDVRAVGNS